MSELTLRLATPADSKTFRAIYAQYIDTSVTFEYELPSEAEFRSRVEDVLTFYPYLAAEADGRVIGYAYAHRAQARAAYQWNAELSVYLDRAATGHGAGAALYTALMRLLAMQGIRTVYGIVTSPNAPSERLHEKLGFARVGLLHSAGFKDGAWYDVSWFERQLALCPASPAAPVPLSALPCGQIAEALRV